MLWMDQQMQHTLHLFGTPVDKAYFCTSKQDLDLYNRDGRRSATVVLWDLHLQPYVRNGQFGACEYQSGSMLTFAWQECR